MVQKNLTKIHPIGYVSYGLTILFFAASVIFATVMTFAASDEWIPEIAFFFKKIPYSLLFKVGYMLFLFANYEDIPIVFGLVFLLLFYLDAGFFCFVLTWSVFRDPRWRWPVCVWFGIRLIGSFIIMSLLSVSIAITLFVLYFLTAYLSPHSGPESRNQATSRI